MKIIALDGYAANPETSWDELKSLGECTIYERTAPTEVLERAAGADILLTNKVVLDAATIASLPDLKYIGVLATGYNIVDTAAARRGIIVTNIPAYSTPSVAQMVFAHILNIARQVQHYTDEIRKGRWSDSPDSASGTLRSSNCAVKIGIIGLGQTGYNTARIAIGFGMEVHAYTSKSPSSFPEIKNGLDGADELFCQLRHHQPALPLTDSTRELINAVRLKQMKPNAILINTGRGPLINEQDLADALNNGTIFAAGLDVLSQEPPRADNPLLTARNCYITPHRLGSAAARERLMQIMLDNVKPS